MVDQRVRIVNIVGTGRSGSTLTDRLLGGVKGALSLGEFVFLWDRGVVGNQLCGCGVEFHECPFWSEVGKSAFGGWESADVSRMVWVAKQPRMQLAPFLLGYEPRRSMQKELRDFAANLGLLYRAVQQVSGAHVLIDSSKCLWWALMLRSVSALDVSYLQLVRDSRDVAFSWTKEVVRPEISDGTTLMPTFSVVRTSRDWVFDNFAFELLRRRHRGLLVRYEDMVADPKAEFQRVMKSIDFGPGSSDAVPETLNVSHTVAGNPMRFSSGGPAIVAKQSGPSLRPRDRAIVSALTLPLLIRYGYLKRSPAHDDY